MDPEKKKRWMLSLVDELLKCGSLKSPETCNKIVDFLVEPIPSRVDRRGDLRTFLASVVSTCFDHAGGIQSLVDTLENWEKGTDQWPAVRRCAQVLIDAEQGAAASPGSSMSSEPLANACALVIGITSYDQRAYELRKEVDSQPFPNLQFASKDAIGFYEFLKASGCEDVPEPLLDEKATRAAIMRALDDLQSRSAKKSLALIFFSGHGARDAEERYYLVPHDGMQNDLFATAVWSKTLGSSLSEIPDNCTALVFVDACHSGGVTDFGLKGTQTFGSEKLAEGSNRYVLASCAAEQGSREKGGHGIFSRRLLGMLSWKEEEGEDEEEKCPEEQIEFFSLYQALKKSVEKRTKSRQSPWSNAKEDTGIVLSINYKKREERTRVETEVYESVKHGLEEQRIPKYTLLLERIAPYIPTGIASQEDRDLYTYFQDMGGELHEGNKLNRIHPEFVRFCERLVARHRGHEIGAGPDRFGKRVSPSAPGNQAMAEQPRGTAPETPARGLPSADKQVLQPAQAGSVISAGCSSSGERRCLRDEDVTSLLAGIVTNLQHSQEVARLEKMLSHGDGVNLSAVSKLILDLYTEKDADWNKLIYGIATRFQNEVWARAYEAGPWVIGSADIEFNALCGRLRNHECPLDEWLAARLKSAFELEEYAGGLGERQQRRVLLCFNTLVHGPSLWDEVRFKGRVLRPETRGFLERDRGLVSPQQLNRMLLEDAYPEVITRAFAQPPGTAAIPLLPPAFGRNSRPSNA